ncbi:MAG: hypothetical protein QOG64_584 [Acidimicrobiaceae bacterium]|nr:hypothetical protein [Acidimicrobiaceae bacterium]
MSDTNEGDRRVRFRRWRSRSLIVGAATVALLASSCGARLSHQQYAQAVRAGGGGGAAGQGVTPGDNTAAGDATAAGPDAGATTATTAAGGTSAPGGPGGPAPGGPATPGGGPQPAGQSGAAPAAGNGGNVDTGVTADSITIGNVSTLTGPVPGLFKGASIGTQAFFAYQNSLGGVFGRKLKLITKDDNLDPGTNDARIKELIPQVFGFVGSFSVVDNGGADSLGKSGVPDAGYSLSRQRSALANNFSPQPSPPGWRLGPLNHFKQQFGPDVISKMAYFTLDVQSAKDIAEGQKAAAQSLGYAFVAGRVIEPNESNFTADVVQMQQKGVKGVMLAGDAATMARLSASMKSQGFSVPFANWGANAYDLSFIPQSNGGAEGALLDMQLPMYLGEDAGSVPEVGLFLQWMKQVAPGQKPDIFAAFSWASARLFVDALQKAGATAKRADVINALKTFNNYDAHGMVAPAGPGTKTPATCYLIVTVKSGKFVRQDDPANGFRCGDGDYFRLPGAG